MDFEMPSPFGPEFHLDVVADAGDVPRADIPSNWLGERKESWLSRHDILKVGIEVAWAAPYLENVRFLTSIAINGGLLANAGRRETVDDLRRAGFEVKEQFGQTIFVPSDELLRAARQSPILANDIIGLDQQLDAVLEEIQIPSVSIVFDIESILLESPAKFTARIWATFRKGEEKVFDVANRLVVYGTLWLVVTKALASPLEQPQPQDPPLPPPGISIQLKTPPPAIGHPGYDAQIQIWHARLTSNNEAERTHGQQIALNRLGIDAGSEDGLDGPATRAARDEYARRHGLVTWDSYPDQLIQLLATESALLDLGLRVPQH